MNRFLKVISTATLFFASSSIADVTIVYPISGAKYPITDPAIGPLKSAYFTSSFSVSCGGDNSVKWGFDDQTIGEAKFYDQLSEQQVWKLPGGVHVFWVDAGSCGTEKVEFQIGD